MNGDPSVGGGEGVLPAVRIARQSVLVQPHGQRLQSRLALAEQPLPRLRVQGAQRQRAHRPRGVPHVQPPARVDPLDDEPARHRRVAVVPLGAADRPGAGALAIGQHAEQGTSGQPVAAAQAALGAGVRQPAGGEGAARIVTRQLDVQHAGPLAQSQPGLEESVGEGGVPLLAPSAPARVPQSVQAEAPQSDVAPAPVAGRGEPLHVPAADPHRPGRDLLHRSTRGGRADLAHLHRAGHSVVARGPVVEDVQRHQVALQRPGRDPLRVGRVGHPPELERLHVGRHRLPPALSPHRQEVQPQPERVRVLAPGVRIP